MDLGATSGTSDDVAIGAGAFFFVSSVGAASSAWTGIAGGSEGREIVVVNVGPSILRVENQDAASAAPNRIITGTGAAVLLVTDDPAVLRYDSIRQRWRLLT